MIQQTLDRACRQPLPEALAGAGAGAGAGLAGSSSSSSSSSSGAALRLPPPYTLDWAVIAGRMCAEAAQPAPTREIRISKSKWTPR